MLNPTLFWRRVEAQAPDQVKTPAALTLIKKKSNDLKTQVIHQKDFFGTLTFELDAPSGYRPRRRLPTKGCRPL